MAPVERSQKTITLSDRAFEEYEAVAQWLNMPSGTLMRQILEAHHQSPSFANLLRRARAGEAPPPASYHGGYDAD
jgi:predicted DNA-binding ribbon-helix-helix protein